VQSTGPLWYKEGMEAYLTKDDVLLALASSTFAEALDWVVGRQPDPFSEHFNDLVCEVMGLYHAKGRKDVDECCEMLADGLRLSYEEALEKGLSGPALKDALVEAIVEESTTTRLQ